MKTLSNLGSPPGNADKGPPVATFKTSVRDWRARYKARRAAQAALAAKAENPTTPA